MTSCFRFVACLILAVAVADAAHAGAADKHLDVYWIDVEGGAATLMVTPAGESILIDTGNPGTRDPGRIFDVVTKVAKLRSLDHVIITHYHRDHFGGASTLAGLLKIGHFYDNGIFEGMRSRPDKSYFELPCGKRSVIQPGQKIELKPSVGKGVAQPALLCLAARQKTIKSPKGASANPSVCQAAKPKPQDMSDNANSVAVLLSFGPFRFYDGGDLTWNIEKKLVCPVNLVGTVDVYQVTHHGLDSSNNPVIVKSLQPSVTVMNNGVTKGCQPQTFATLRSAKSIQAMYQMHKNMRKDRQNNAEDKLIANGVEKIDKCKGNYIKLSVHPDGKRYTVTIPSKGHSRTFETKLKKS